jgi:hypothetical protein
MADSLIQLCGIAARKLGLKPISSFVDGTKAAEVFALIWPGVLGRCLDAEVWHFATKTLELGNVTADPQYGAPADPNWTTTFALPVEYRRLYKVLNSSGHELISGWEIEGDRLYSNESRILLRFSRDYSEADFPNQRTWFQNYFASSLAYESASALTAVDADIARMLGETQAALKAAIAANAREAPGATLPVGHLRAVRSN